MWRNYLTVGIRALAKNKTYTSINIFGLALGLAVCLLIFLYVRYETGYDSWLQHADRTYQVQTTFLSHDEGPTAIQLTSYVAPRILEKDFPEIEAATGTFGTVPAVLVNGTVESVEHAQMVDSNFLQVLRLPLVAGNPNTAFSQANSVVIDQSVAQRFFGNKPALGRTLTIQDGKNARDLRVTGVMADQPANSHIKLSWLQRIDPKDLEGQEWRFDWTNQSGFVYVRLRRGADAATINARMTDFVRRNVPTSEYGDDTVDVTKRLSLKLVSARDVHLGEAQRWGMRPGNDRQTVAMFGIVALLILFMAGVNFVNLSTARAGQRAREVALRKVLGASRKQLIAQFIAESTLIASVAALVGLALLELLLPFLGAILKVELSLAYLGPAGVLLPLVALVLLIGVIGGFYPAFVLSRFDPAAILKANQSTAGAGGSGRLRSVLVVTQFAISVGLIACTLVVYAQTVFARTTDLGFHREGLIVIENLWGPTSKEKEALAERIRRLQGVQGATLTGYGPGQENNSNSNVYNPGKSSPIRIGSYGIDPDYVDVMGVKLIAGRNLTRDNALDRFYLPPGSTPEDEAALAERGLNYIVNVSGAKKLGFANPKDAIGHVARLALLDPEKNLVNGRIVGVIDDVRVRSIREAPDPSTFYYRLSYADKVVVRYSSNEPTEVMSALERVWKEAVPTTPIKGRFVEDIDAELYAADVMRGRVFGAFALMAMIIACLGLFGLASFTAERRTKEIGIRKVFGARVRDIVRLLAWQFSKPVVLANLIAWPVASSVMRDWLNQFDTRITLGPGPFLLAGILALTIALGTIASHAFRVARSNPIHALRYE